MLEYHRRLCKAVHAGTIEMFATGAELNWPVLYVVSHPLQFGTASVSTAAAHKAGKPKGTAPTTHTAAARGSPAVPKHPAGSCVNHSTSTSHTTAEYQKK